VNQHRIFNGFEDAQEFSPNLHLVLDGVRPQAVLNDRRALADTNANKVVEIAVGETFDI
jgi:hypothetical protein